MPSTNYWKACLLVTLLALAPACWRRTPAPVATVRVPCLRSPAPPPSSEWIATAYSVPERTDVLWQRIELLERWAARAWAACGGRR